MTTRQILHTICNGCGRSSLHDEIRIVQTEDKHRGIATTQTLDVCEDCANQDRYICRLCNDVHSDDEPCEGVERMADEAELAREGQFDGCG